MAQLKYLFALVTTSQLILFAIAANDFSGNFIMSNSKNDDKILENHAYAEGVLHYDGSNRRMVMDYTGLDYKEHISFNNKDGRSNFDDQVFYQLSDSHCEGGCERAKANLVNPLFTNPAEGYDATGQTREFKSLGETCEKLTFDGKAESPYAIMEMWIAGDDTLCGFTLENGHMFEMTSHETLASASNFDLPSNCKCREKLEFILQLDGSGSISDAEWKDVNEWVRKLIDAVSWGSGGSRMAVVQYASSAKLMLSFTGGKSNLENFFAGDINQFKGGTQVLNAMDISYNKLYPDTRSDSTTVVITLTDGRDAASASKIKDEVNKHKKNKGVDDFIAISVGNNVGDAQLEALAGGDKSRIHRYDDFKSLKENIDDIVDDACAAQLGGLSDCGGGCCGFCACQSCLTPDGCDDGKECTKNELESVSSGLECCATPIEDHCSSYDDKCHKGVCASDGSCKAEETCKTNHPCKKAVCDEDKGCRTIDNTADACDTKCQNVYCSSDENNEAVCQILSCSNCSENSDCSKEVLGCYNYTGTCLTDEGSCEYHDMCEQPDNGCLVSYCTQGENDSNSTCIEVSRDVDDGNACTVDVCYNLGGGKYSVGHHPVECLNNTDQCVEVSCDSTTGNCTEKDTSDKCDDNNLCTEDKCDPDEGCVFIDISGQCDNSSECLNMTCDPMRGCVSESVDCPDGDGKCSFGVCSNETCEVNNPSICKGDIIGIGAGIGGAAIAGIVIAAVVFAALSGTAAVKGYQALHASESDFNDAGSSSPIYESGTVGGSNALYGAGENAYEKF